MISSLDAGLTLPFLAFVIASGLVGGTHPSLVSTLPLILGSYLGNELRLHHALRGVALFIVLLTLEWVIIGAGVSTAVALFDPSAIQTALAVIVAVAGALELASAISRKGINMEIPTKSWRHIRKHAYQLTRPWQIFRLNLHLLPFLLVLVAWPLIGISALTAIDDAALSLTLIAIHAICLVIPLALIAFLPVSNVKLSTIHHLISRFTPLLHLLQAIILWLCSWLLLSAADNSGGVS